MEQDATAWWDATATAVRQLDLHRERVKGIGLAGQLNGCVCVDRTGVPLRPAIIWLDNRATEEARYLAQEFQREINAYGLTSPRPIHVLTKLVWMRNHEPETLDRTHKVLFVKDFVAHKLTGVFATDVSDAGAALLLDIRKRRYATEFLDSILDIDKLPEVYESQEIVGRLSGEAASTLGLDRGIPVAIGAGDTTALAVGMGVDRPGTACATIGTAGHIAVYMDTIPDAIDPGSWIMCHGIPGKYYWHGLVMTGGYSLDWYMERVSRGLVPESDREITYDTALELTSDVEPASDGLLFLPFLLGVATPHADPYATASWIGLTPRHGTRHMLRAVLEGVAYNFRDSFESLRRISRIPIDELFIGEGGARNPVWPQIITDVLGLSATVRGELNASAMGAAMLGGIGAGFWNGLSEAKEALLIDQRRIVYDEERHRRYDESYALYGEAYGGLKEVYRRLAEARGRGRNDV